MASWQSTNLIGIPGLTYLVDLMKDANKVVQIQQGIYEARTALSDILAIGDDALDGFTLVVQAVQNIINDMLKANVYGIALGPRLFQDLLPKAVDGKDLIRFEGDGLTEDYTAADLLAGFSSDDLIGQLIASFDDTADGDRPTFSTDAVVCGVIFTFGVDTVLELEPIFAYLEKLFDGASWTAPFKDALSKLDAYKNVVRDPPFVGEGTPPDWGVATGILPPFKKAMTHLLGFVEGFDAVGKTSLLTDIIDDVASTWFGMLTEGLDVLEGIINDLVVAGEGVGPGVNIHMLPIPPEKGEGGDLGGGVPRFTQRVALAGNKPQDKYSIGLCLLSGAPSYDALVIQWNALVAVLRLED